MNNYMQSKILEKTKNKNKNKTKMQFFSFLKI